MPPKNKRKEHDVGTAEPTTRVTRRSARGKDAVAAEASTETVPATESVKLTMNPASASSIPATGAATSSGHMEASAQDGDLPGARPTRAKRKKVTEEDQKPKPRNVKQKIDNPLDTAVKTATRTSQSKFNDPGTLKAANAKKRGDDLSVGPSKTDATIVVPPTPLLKKQPSKAPTYDRARATALFKAHAESDDPDIIGPEGLEKLCEEGEIPMDGVMPLLLAWQLDAKEMAKFTRAEWLKAMDELRIDTLSALVKALTDLQELLILPRKPVLKRPMSSASRKQTAFDPYNKSRYVSYALDTKDAFTKFYAYCFKLAKPESARNIDMETATAFWFTMIAQRPTEKVTRSIQEKGTYKGVNKDLWTMMHEFCQAVKPSLEGYDSDGAWPTLLDDFVTWKKSSIGDPETTQVDA